MTRHPVPPLSVLVGTYLEQQVLREGQALHARQGGLPRLHGKHLFVLEDLQARVDLLQLLHNALHPSPIPTVPLSLSLSLRARAIDLAPPGSLGLFFGKTFSPPQFQSSRLAGDLSSCDGALEGNHVDRGASDGKRGSGGAKGGEPLRPRGTTNLAPARGEDPLAGFEAGAEA